MTPAMEEQARRWMDHPRFQWMPGMRRLRNAPGYADHLKPQGRYPDDGDDGFTEGCIPDLNDPATLGALYCNAVGRDRLLDAIEPTEAPEEPENGGSLYRTTLSGVYLCGTEWVKLEPAEFDRLMDAIDLKKPLKHS